MAFPYQASCREYLSLYFLSIKALYAAIQSTPVYSSYNADYAQLIKHYPNTKMLNILITYSKLFFISFSLRGFLKECPLLESGSWKLLLSNRDLRELLWRRAFIEESQLKSVHQKRSPKELLLNKQTFKQKLNLLKNISSSLSISNYAKPLIASLFYI